MIKRFREEHELPSMRKEMQLRKKHTVLFLRNSGLIHFWMRPRNSTWGSVRPSLLPSVPPSVGLPIRPSVSPVTFFKNMRRVHFLAIFGLFTQLTGLLRLYPDIFMLVLTFCKVISKTKTVIYLYFISLSLIFFWKFQYFLRTILLYWLHAVYKSIKESS